MTTGHEDELKKKNWAGRRNMPMSPTTMAVGGILVAGTIAYFMFYDKNKNNRLGTDRDLGRKFVDNTTTQPPPPPPPRS